RAKKPLRSSLGVSLAIGDEVDCTCSEVVLASCVSDGFASVDDVLSSLVCSVSVFVFSAEALSSVEVLVVEGATASLSLDATLVVEVVSVVATVEAPLSSVLVSAEG